MPKAWESDVLGAGFLSCRLKLPGGERATLVKFSGAEAGVGAGLDTSVGGAGPDNRAVVIYLHGWSDYFFHRRLAEFWAAQGAAFYAIDLRNYGRNLTRPLVVSDVPEDHQWPPGLRVDGSAAGTGDAGGPGGAGSDAETGDAGGASPDATQAELDTLALAGKPSAAAAARNQPVHLLTETPPDAEPDFSTWNNLEAAAREWLAEVSKKVLPESIQARHFAQAPGEPKSGKHEHNATDVLSMAANPSQKTTSPEPSDSVDGDDDPSVQVISESTQLPGYIEKLEDYGQEITAALQIIRSEHPDAPLILAGHSTGGLVASLWAADNPDQVAALVLNSPWLEFQFDATARRMIAPILTAQARRRSQNPLRLRLPTNYNRAVLQTHHGQLPYKLEWKPPGSFPIYPAWLAAVFAGHARVAAGLGLDIPVLVMLSDHSVRKSSWIEDMVSADIVLDVDVVARRALSLGRRVVIERLPDAMHDVFLSAAETQDRAYQVMTEFFRGYVV